MKVFVKQLTCQCGLVFALLDFVHSRKRGYCSYSCRKKAIAQKKLARSNLFL
jgi:hypothetical protein